MTTPINTNTAIGEIHDVIERQSARSKENPAPEQTHGQQGADQVTLTSDARQITELVKTAASEPDVDRTRVEALRDLIARGEYKVDSASIADRLVDFEKLLGS